MLFAKYKKQLRRWFWEWSFWLALPGIPWMLKGRSPLVWPNLWGVAEWLAWTAIAAAILELGSGQLTREFPGRDRLQDVLILIGFFVRRLSSIAAFFGLVAARLYFYAWDALPDLRLFIRQIGPGGAVKFACMIALLFTFWSFLTFVCRLIATLFRQYDEAPSV